MAMKNILFFGYNHMKIFGNDLIRYLRFSLTRRTSLIFLSGIFIFFLIFQIDFDQEQPNTKIYYDPIRKTILDRYNKTNLMHDKAQGPATCLIIIRSADGAIGNRMFLFASAYGLARLHQCQLYVAPWILNDLRTTFRININQTKVQLTTDDSLVVNRTDIFGRYSACTLYTDLFQIPFNSTFNRYEMVGFYQAYGYFDKFKEEVAYLFQFNTDVTERNVPVVENLFKAVWNRSLDLGNYTKSTIPYAYLKSLLINPPSPYTPVTWIGIHIRRGDFLSFFRIDTSVEYLTWAMNYYRRKYFNCRFLIASDDKKYVRTNLGNNTDIFITPDNFFHGHDLGALGLCEHTIVTAGTFGWWAAWLAGGDVVHDLNYPVPFQNCIKEHYFPPWFLFPHNSSSLRWTPPNQQK